MSTGRLGHWPLLDLREDLWPGHKGCVDQSRTHTGGSWSPTSLHELLSVDMEPEVAVSPFRLPGCGCSLRLALLPMRSQLPLYLCSPALPVFANLTSCASEWLLAVSVAVVWAQTSHGWKNFGHYLRYFSASLPLFRLIIHLLDYSILVNRPLKFWGRFILRERASFLATQRLFQHSPCPGWSKGRPCCSTPRTKVGHQGT